MTELHVICRRKAVGILTRRTYVATEYFGDMLNRTSQNILSVREIRVVSAVIMTQVIVLTKGNITGSNVKNIIGDQMKHNLFPRHQFWCITKHI
jgi:hypothetical protein